MTNAAVAIAVLIALGFLDESHWLLRLENSAMDTMMEFNKGLTRMSKASDPVPLEFTLLDIDEQSFRAWQEPYHTPRDKLLQLIRFAVESGARLVAVDVDLSKPGIDEAHDRDLADYLSDADAIGGVPVILVRSFYGGGEGQRPWGEIRPSFLDAYELPASVHWSMALFQATLWDGVVRHWHLARFACLAGRPQLVPSVQLTAAVLLSKDFEVPPFADIETIGYEACNRSTGNGPATTAARSWNSDTITFDTELGQRLIYTIPWHDPAPDLVTIPAIAVTEASGPLADDLIRGRVVVIGASFADGKDIHRTPIGEMPGALIVVNAIKSILVFGQVREPSTFMQWLQRLGVILIAAWAFSRFDSFIALGVAAALVFVVLVPVSFYFFKYGLWIEFSIPLLAMVAHRGVSEYREARNRLRAARASAGTAG